MKKGEIVVSGVFLLIGGYVLYEIATTFVELGIASGGGRNNAALFPRILALLLVGVSLLHLGNGLLRHRRRSDRVGASVHDAGEVRAEGSIGRQLVLLVAFFAYLVLIPIIGYIVLTPVALFTMFLVLGVRRVPLSLLISVATTFVVWFLFSELMNIPMPIGRFGWYL